MSRIHKTLSFGELKRRHGVVRTGCLKLFFGVTAALADYLEAAVFRDYRGWFDPSIDPNGPRPGPGWYDPSFDSNGPSLRQPWSPPPFKAWKRPSPSVPLVRRWPERCYRQVSFAKRRRTIRAGCR